MEKEENEVKIVILHAIIILELEKNSKTVMGMGGSDVGGSEVSGDC
jgi:hypothetical protein